MESEAKLRLEIWQAGSPTTTVCGAAADGGGGGFTRRTITTPRDTRLSPPELVIFLFKCLHCGINKGFIFKL